MRLGVAQGYLHLKAVVNNVRCFVRVFIYVLLWKGGAYSHGCVVI